MALSFIGKPISLISHSDVRYRGILAGIDPAASTIQLSNVYSMGTESRKPATEFIPPVQEPYQYIIFRASEVKDLAVDEPSPRRSVHDDPAVLGASAPGTAQPAYPPYGSPYQPQAVAQPPPPPPPPPQQPPPAPYPQQPPHIHVEAPQVPQVPPVLPVAPAHVDGGPSTSINVRRVPSNSVHTAAASMETVERAIGDLRVSNGAVANGRGGRRGGHGGHGHGHGHGHHGHGQEVKTNELKVPATDFDFQSSNARFDKAAVGPKKKETGDDENTNPSDGEGRENGKETKEERAYNPEKSFFDSLSSSTQAAPPPPRGAGGRRGGGRNRREEERERNVATFGEPGGVGLMGPGAYVGGWGGYGRRGGRPRRGAPAVVGR
ncbi:Scd6-like Sm domain-containing protein [Phlebopus sp. FC_14]|nr:Scd6-like Sm domain-containing protein [Phlebopus sp. FC_14]